MTTAPDAPQPPEAAEAPQAPARIDYDGRRFQPTEEPADPANPTVGTYHQDGDLVWAEISGGSIRIGRLVGSCGPDGVIDAGYCFVTAGGEVVAGATLSRPTVLPDGRIRLDEHWRRLDGSSGVSHIEELAP